MIRAELQFFHDWLTHPRFAAILPELSAEAARSPEVAKALDAAIGTPRREIGAQTLRRGFARGELPVDLVLRALGATITPTGDGEPGPRRS